MTAARAYARNPRRRTTRPNARKAAARLRREYKSLLEGMRVEPCLVSAFLADLDEAFQQLSEEAYK